MMSTDDILEEKRKRTRD